MENLPLFGELAAIAPVWALVVAVIVVMMALSYVGAPMLVWTLGGAVALYGFGAPVWLWAVFGVVAVLFNVAPIRRMISGGVMKVMDAAGFLPAISKTEQVAIDAGTVWMDAELFSGKPDFKTVLNQPYPELTPAEQAFIDGPVEELCRMTDDWDVFQRRDLPKEVWDFMAKHNFFGLIIPKEYGGHGFSALANSAIVQKVSSRNAVLAITVMVPNSLGPAELLIHYGTQAQRDHYLPRLASHDEIPAFALTEPNAGSDAGALSASGVVFKGDDGELYLRLNWQKRYITLAPIATVLGLAFKLFDPDNLLGKGKAPGITCALIQTDLAGVDNSRRHDPAAIPFYNGPTEGHDVIVPIDAIIGGAEGAGNGWRMLMESLAAGRGISLPATAAGGSKHVYRTASAHAAVRKQFGLSIGKFEGIEEPLARIGGYTYLIEAARRYTCGALDEGAKPAVVTAMMKYNMTELGREIINDGMDVQGGNAICRGPRNLLMHGYMNTPIGITVEGANILPRTLMILAPGALRCHPYELKEIQALSAGDVAAFDKAFWAHIGHVGRNKARALLLSLTRGRLAGSPVSGPSAKYVRKLSWASASFAFMADVAMGTLGGNLKRKEKLTGRFADIFSWMYIASATIRRFEAEGRPKEDLAFYLWSMDYAMWRIQQAFDGLYSNMTIPGLTWMVRGPMAWWSRLNALGRYPSDKLGHKVAAQMQVPGEQRDRMTRGAYISTDKHDALGRLDHAMALSVEAEDIGRKLKAAIRTKALPKSSPAKLVKMALDKSILTPAEAGLLQRAEEARNDAIQVDAFTADEYFRTAAKPDPASGDGASLAVPTPKVQA